MGLSCKNITVKYDSHTAIQNVSFDVKTLDYLCIVGENGSGKSTLMKCLLGLIKPSEGQIIYDGMASVDIGYLSQQTPVQKDFPASVYEVVLSGRLNKCGIFPFYQKSDRKSASDYLQVLNIEALKNKSYRDLSGGQQQRVLLARALCAAGKLLLLDEPASGLDPEGTAEMYDLLQKLNKQQAITIIMITHDIRNAVKYGSKILHMRTSPVYFGSAAGYAGTEIGKKMLGGEENA